MCFFISQENDDSFVGWSIVKLKHLKQRTTLSWKQIENPMEKTKKPVVHMPFSLFSTFVHCILLLYQLKCYFREFMIIANIILQLGIKRIIFLILILLR